MKDALIWLTGRGRYYYLLQCLGGNIVVCTLACLLCTAIIIGYKVIANKWESSSAASTDRESVQALMKLKRIFVWCGIAGYGFTVVKLFTPAWELYLIALTFLCYWTWAFVWQSQKLTSVFVKLDRFERVRVALRDSGNDDVLSEIEEIIADLKQE